MRTRLSRKERKESKQATLRLRRFRVGEVERLREDAMRFSLSDAVTMASIRREVSALITEHTGRTKMNLESGRLVSVQSGEWFYELNGSEVKATKRKP